MKARPDFNQRREPPIHRDAASCRFHDSAEMLQHRTLAGAVVTDDTERLTLPELKRHVVEDPKLLGRERAITIRGDGALHQGRNQLPQGIVPLASTKALVHMIELQRILTHCYTLSAKRGSSRRKKTTPNQKSRCRKKRDGKSPARER